MRAIDMTVRLYNAENGEPDFASMTAAERELHLWLEADDETPSE